MDNVHYRPSWRRIIALASLVSFLCLSVVSASHIHSGTATGSVKNECRICLTGGASRSLPVSTQAFATVVPTFFPLLLRQEFPYPTRYFSSDTPRSPPLF